MLEKAGPKVSICIPSYNYGHFISQAIDSVLAQTFIDFELIIFDNCSTDNTKEVAKAYVDRDVRISYFCNKTNIGMVGNWNECIKIAQGEYIKILCADDLLTPDCIEKCVQVLEENPAVTLVSSARLLVTRSLEPIKSLSYSSKFEIVDGQVATRRCLLEWNVIGEPTAALFRKACLTCGFNPNYRQAADVEMWFNLLKKGQYAYIPDTLCLLRMHEDQTTKLNTISAAVLYDDLQLAGEYIDNPEYRIPLYLRHRVKFFRSYSLWKSRGIEDKELTKKAIGRFYNLYLFFFLLALKNINKYFSTLCR